MRTRTLALAAILASTALALPASAQTRQAPDNTQVGTLTCTVEGGAGFIITSSKALSCLFRSARGERDFYTGTIRNFGLDIGGTTEGRLAWSVFAPTNRLGRGALEGTYSGVSGQATVGAGVGANLLVGGNGDTLSLQPLSFSQQQGLNLAIGVASMELERAVAVRRSGR